LLGVGALRSSVDAATCSLAMLLLPCCTAAWADIKPKSARWPFTWGCKQELYRDEEDEEASTRVPVSPRK